MKVYHIAAMSENRVIGRRGKIPWRIREDLSRFKEITLGHPIIMGRLTFESMMPYMPLKGRRNIVLTSRNKLEHDGDVVLDKNDRVRTFEAPNTELVLANTIGEAFELCEGANEVYVIGGGYVYLQTLDYADELRLTIVHREVEGGDAFYPEIDEDEWIPSFIEPHGEYSYVDYVRRDFEPI